MTRPGVLAALVLVSAVWAAPAAAQADEGPTFRPRRFSVGGGVLWLGGFDLGDQAAELRRNAPGSQPPAFTLFRADARLERAAAVEARVGFALTPSLQVELRGSYARPQLVIAISDDPESSPETLEGEQLSQYVVDAAVVWLVPRLRIAQAARTYVSGGGGYLRQLHEDNALVETGQLYHAGGGVQYWLRGADGSRRPLAVRADVRMYVRRNGVEFADRLRVFPAASASVYFGF